MSVVNVSVLDDRTDGSNVSKRCDWISYPSSSEYRIVVNETTSLDTLFSEVKKRLGAKDKIGTLSILCHGIGRYQYPDEERKKKPQIHGGFGLDSAKRVYFSTMRSCLPRSKAPSTRKKVPS